MKFPVLCFNTHIRREESPTKSQKKMANNELNNNPINLLILIRVLFVCRFSSLMYTNKPTSDPLGTKEK